MDLSLSQLAGSQADGPVLLEQLAFTLTRKAKQKRGRRLETLYLVSFEGLPESEDNWYTDQQLRKLPNYDRLVAELRASEEQCEELPDKDDLPASETEDGGQDIGMSMPPLDGSSSGGGSARKVPFTQQPSEAQLPQTQAPSQLGAALSLAAALGQEAAAQAAGSGSPAPATQQYAEALRRLQATRNVSAAPAAVPLAQRRMGMLNGLMTSLWERDGAADGSPKTRIHAPLAPAQTQAASFPSPRLGDSRTAEPAEELCSWPPPDVPGPSLDDVTAAIWAQQQEQQQPLEVRPTVPPQYPHAQQPQQAPPAGVAQEARPLWGQWAAQQWHQAVQGPSPPATVQHVQGSPEALAGAAPGGQQRLQQPRRVPESFGCRQARATHWLGPIAAAAPSAAQATAPPSHWASPGRDPRRAPPQHTPPPAAAAGATQGTPQSRTVAPAASPGNLPRVSAAAPPAEAAAAPEQASPNERQAADLLHVHAQLLETVRAALGSQAQVHIGVTMPPSPAPGPAPPVSAAAPMQPPAAPTWPFPTTAAHAPSSHPPTAGPAPIQIARNMPPAMPEQPPLAAAQPHAQFYEAAPAPPPAHIPSWPPAYPVGPLPAAAPAPSWSNQPAGASGAGKGNSLEGVGEVRMAPELCRALQQQAAAALARAARPTPAAEQLRESTAGRSASAVQPQSRCSRQAQAPAASPALVQSAAWGAWAAAIKAAGSVQGFAARQIVPEGPLAHRAFQGVPSALPPSSPPTAAIEAVEEDDPIQDANPDEAAQAAPQQDSQEKRRRVRPRKKLKRIYAPEELAAAGADSAAAAQEPPGNGEGSSSAAQEDAMHEANLQRVASTAAHPDQASPARPALGAEASPLGAAAHIEVQATTPAAEGCSDEIDDVDAYGLTPDTRERFDTMMEGAIIRRARQDGDGAENLHLLIRWPDRVDTWVRVGALHVRERWHFKLIRFYESKAKKVNREPAGRQAEAAAAASDGEETAAHHLDI